MAIDKNSKAYQGLLNMGYTDNEISQMYNSVSSGQNAKQVLADMNAQKSRATPNYENQGAGNYVYNEKTGYYENTSNKSNNTSNQNISTSNNNSGSSSAGTKSSPYQNQGAGNYTYNPTSGYYEKQQSQTSTPASTNTNTSSGGMSATRQYWEGLSYEQQQEKINQAPGLKEAITKKGWDIKTAGGQGQTGTTQTNPGGWDYQDNSEARMMEIANNLNGYRISNPELFNDWGTFSNFFINGKGRSQEQIDFLKSYFDAVKKYNSYDNMSAPTVGDMVARGEIPDDYLNYLKYSNPDRYAEVMDYKDTAEKGIMNETYYSNLISNSNDPKWMAWAKENQFIIDRNNDDIDDRLYHAPTEEEQTLVNEYSTLASEQLADQNTYRDLMSDLREQYPDADESTLMILAGDRGKKIQDRMDTRNVTMTKLNGQIKYLQDERSTQDSAGQRTIAELQKAYGMYYDYSPEGMAELAQAQYAATNITLDQADNGTDAQKQMALQSVLDDYYDKYGSIIQRSEQQVIGDVMAYAKEKGISLSQALEENFLKPLRSKPQFATLSSGGDLGYEPKIYKVGDNGYYFDENGNLVSIGGGTLGGGTTNGGLYGFTNYTPISTEKKESTLNDFMNKRKEGTAGGECGSFVNDYLEALGYDRLYDDPIDKKKAVTNSDTATIGSVAVMDSKKYPQYGHVAIVTDINGDKVKLLESNRNDDHKVHTTRWVNKSDIAGYFDPSKTPSSGNAGNGGNYNPDLETFFSKWRDGAGDRLKEKDFWATFAKDIEGKGVSKEEFLKQYGEWYAYTSRDAYEKLLSDIDHLIELTGDEFSKTERAGVFTGIGTTAKVYNYIRNNQTLNAIIEAKNRGAKLGVLSDSDVKMLKEAASILDWDVNQETWAKELYDYRESILNNNKYLREKYGRQSAYSTDKLLDYDNNNKAYTISSKGGSGSTKKTSKRITTLGR